MENIKPGEIGMANFPLAEKAGALVHPVLVMGVETTLSGAMYAVVAYGSSQNVSRSGHLAHEFVLTPEDGQAFSKAGLRKATRFDLRKTARIPCDEIRQIGLVDLKDRAMYARLRDATFAAQ